MKEINATKKGIIIAVLLIVVSLLLFYIFKLPENGNSQYAVLGLYITGILWSLISYKKFAPSNARFKEFFSTGFKTFIVVTFFMVIFTFIFYKFNPQILENAIIENNNLVMKEGNRTPVEIEENANKLRSIFMPMMLAITTIKFLILGTLISVIAAGFLSQKKN
jgi:hypothetical protein